MSSATLQLGGDNWAAKDGNLLGYQRSASSSVHIPHEFTFTRGSNLAATRVAANGLIEKGRENLLLQSNQFDTTWVSVTASVTSGQSGYDGSNDAWLLSKSAASGRIYQNASVSGVATYSVYAKSNDLDWLFIIGTPSSYPEAYFNLSNGTIGNTSNHQNFIGANIEDVGNGWYRCSITFNDSLGQFRIYPADGNNDFSGTSGSIYIQDAQLEQGLVATDYIETGATTVQAGLLENEPRIDYTGGTGSLLLEPSRTNLVPYSEYLNDWTKIGLSIETNTSNTLSPEGLYNATKLTSTTADPNIYKMISVTATETTFSFYIKGEGSSIGKTSRVLFWYIGTATGSTTSHNFTLTSEWQRISFSTTPTSSGTIGFRIDTPADSADVGETAYIYGVQIEEGSYPTSYIPNHSGGSVTRAADDATLEYSNNFNDITILTEVNSLDVIRDTSQQNLHIGNDYSQGGAFFLRRSSSTSPKTLVAFFKNNDNSDVFSPYELPEGDSKVALKYNSTSNACKLFVDGSEVRSGTATDITEFDTFRLIGQGGKFNSKQLEVFNTALSDAQCITRTTL